MSDWTCNDRVVHAGSLRLPRRGAWGGDVEVGSDSALPEALTLVAGGVEWTARLVAQTLLGGVVRARFLAGRVDLSAELSSRAWSVRSGSDAPLAWRRVIEDTLVDLGASLDSSTDAALLERGLAMWHRAACRGVDALNAIAAALDCTWRVSRDGRVLFVVDAWTAVPEGEWDTEEARPESLHLTAQDLDTRLAPGATLQGRKVESVTWIATQAMVAAEVAFYRAGLPDDDIGRMVRELVRQEIAPLRYLGLFDAQVVSQESDGYVACRLSNPAFPDVVRAQLCGPVPGAKLTLNAGARVLVQFIYTGPTTPMHPIATLHPDREAQGSLGLLEMGPAVSMARIAREGDSVNGGTVTAVAGATPVQFIYTPVGGSPGAPSSTLALSGGRVTSGSDHGSLG